MNAKILSDEQIQLAAMQANPQLYFTEFARAIEAAVLADLQKLAIATITKPIDCSHQNPIDETVKDAELISVLTKAGEAINKALFWDRERVHIMPYRVRDPLHIAIAEIEKVLPC